MTTPAEPSAARRLVDALDIDGQDLPPSTLDAVLRSTMQIMGVARLGLANGIARSGIDYVTTAEHGGSTVISRGRVASAPGAAFANALASHSDFREDTHAESQSHPGVVVIPAVFAVAESLGRPLAPGRYAAAVVAGHELIGRLGRAGAILSTERGFRAPSLYTVFGATLAACITLDLDAETRVHAIAIAAQGAAGINQPFAEGTDDWFLAPAFAARHAVTSALLAAAGVQGSPHVLEGVDGVFEAFSGRVPDIDFAKAGPHYEIEHTRLKGALTCGFNQSLVYQLSQLDVPTERLERVDIRLSPGAAHYPGVAGRGPYESKTTALLSAPYAAALQLVRGSLDQGGYSDLGAPDLLDVTRIVFVEADAALEGYATQIDLHLAGGETISVEDGNDNPGFSLDTVQRVTDTLRRNYRSGGLDENLVDGLEAGARAMMAGDSGPLGDALS
ncbi:MAG: hypothetical protein JWP19_270 [Rhodoglobus sp.]|nr:hypothetical protein [Rhodoglobus sp.]